MNRLALDATLTQLLTKIGIGQYVVNGFLNRFVIGRGHLEPGVSHNFREGAGVRDHDRDSTSHRLQGWKTEPFIQGQKRKGIRSMVEVWHVGAGNEIEHHALSTVAQILCRLYHLTPPPSLPAENQLMWDPTGLLQAAEDPD